MMEFEEVTANDFITITPGKVATYVKIEQILMEIGGGGTEGTAFKKEALKKAGWKYDSLVGYSKNPEVAAQAFNKIREIISKTKEKEQFLTMLN